MKNIIFSFATLASVNALAWGAPDLLPKNQREASFSVETKLDKNKAFQKLLIWSSKAINDSNESIKLKDQENGILIAKVTVDCDVLKLGSGYAKDQRLEMTLEFSVEKNKVEIKATDVLGRGEGYDDGSRPSKKEEMESASKSCIQPVIDEIKSNLK